MAFISPERAGVPNYFHSPGRGLFEEARDQTGREEVMRDKGNSWRATDAGTVESGQPKQPTYFARSQQ